MILNFSSLKDSLLTDNALSFLKEKPSGAAHGKCYSPQDTKINKTPLRTQIKEKTPHSLLSSWKFTRIHSASSLSKNDISEIDAVKHNKLINDRLIKINQGVFSSLVVSPCDVYEILRKTIDSFCLKAHQRGYTLQIEAKGQKPSLLSDPFLLKIVFIYALVNVFVRLPKHGRLKIEIKSLGDKTRIILKDNGYYLDEKTKSILLRKHGVSYRDDLICRRIIKTLGGEMSFKDLSANSHEIILLFPQEIKSTTAI